MMNIIRNWVVGEKPPQTNDGWLHKGVAKYFTNGKWQIIGDGHEDPFNDILDIELTEEEFNKVLSNETIIIQNEDANADYNVIRLHINESVYALSKNIQTNGTASYSSSNIIGTELLTIEAIVSEGVITLLLKSIKVVDTVELEIGNSEEVKANNLSKLKGGFFFSQLDYGYGVGTWHPTNGGIVHIVTAHGNDVFYDINANGSIIKNEYYLKPNEPYTIDIDFGGYSEIAISPELEEKLIHCTEINVIRCGVDDQLVPVKFIRNNITASPHIGDVYFKGPIKDRYVTSLIIESENGTNYLKKVDIEFSTASDKALGLIKVGFSQVDKKYPVKLDNSNNAYVEVPWTDTKYSLPAATKTTLGGIKGVTNIASLDTNADTATIISTVNTLINQLREAGILIS